MGFYIPSFIQKRILRYALAKLDILDTDALDLESLGITWGKRSSFELRDVGLRKDRLSALLGLPDTVVIREAKIRLLRLTIPADIHASGIIFEAEGVYIDIFANTLEKPGHAADSRQGARTGESGQGRASKVASTPEAEEPTTDGIPTTADLAQSFVDTESAEEKAQLKAAVAKSYKIEAPALSDSFEYGTEAGYGAPLSLPWFVADFLHGIKARTQASVKDVQVDLSAKVDLSSFSPPRGPNGDVEDLRIRISIASLDLFPVAQMSVPQDGPGGPNAAGTPSSGRRRIGVRDIRATLLSDSSVLSFMSGLSGPPSPSVTHSSTYRTGFYESKTSSSPLSSRSVQETLSSQGAELPPTSVHDTPELFHSQISNDERQLQSALGSQLLSGEILSNPGLDQSNLEESTAISPQASFQMSSSRQSSQHEPTEESRGELALSKSHNSQSDDQSSDVPSALLDSTLEKVLPKTASTILQRQSSGADSAGSSPDSDMFHSMPSASPTQQYSQQPPNAAHQSTDSGVESDEEAGALEELSKSRVFSHEEAASMYQSAISQAALSSPVDVDGAQESHTEQELASQDHPEILEVKNATQDDIPHRLASSAEQSGQAEPLMVAEANQPTEPETPTMPEASRGTLLPADDHLHASQTGDSQPIQPQDVPSPETGCVVKEFFTIATIDVDFEELNPLHDHTASVEESKDGGPRPTKNIPGGFSESMISIDTSVYDTSSPKDPTQQRYTSASNTERVASESPVRIKVGRIQLTCDIGLMSLAVLSFQQISSAPSSAAGEESKTPSAVPHMELELERLGLAFVSELKGVWRSSKQLNASSVPAPEQDVLLDLILANVSFSQSFSDDTIHRRIAVGTFTFGYKNESIISFDASLKMRDSIRDTLSPTGHDVTVDLTTKLGRATDVVIMTLPLHVKLNLTRLDETFSWVGGLSGILELSSSVISTATVTESASKARQTKPNRPSRNVRFASPPPARSKPTPKIDSAPAKITARIGGLAFDLIGSKSVITLDGTAVKVARRGEAVRINIDRLNLRGPILPNSDGHSAITLTFELVKLVHLQSPEENDLDRLLALLAPSRDYEESAGDILLDTFLRQRRQGTILRAHVQTCRGTVEQTRDLDAIPVLLSELQKLAPMAKYIPEDDRPGLLLLSRIDSLALQLETDHALGRISLQTTNAEVAHVSLPSILLLGVGSLNLLQANKELAGPLVASTQVTGEESSSSHPPMVHARFIGDEMDPTMKIKLWNLRLEYHISTVMALLGVQETATGEVVVAELVESVAALTAHSSSKSDTSLTSATKKSEHERPLKFELAFRDSAIGLNPRNSLARGLLHLTNVSFLGGLPEKTSGDMHGTLTVQKMALLIVDDATALVATEPNEGATTSASQQEGSQLHALTKMGYVKISEISTASVTVNLLSDGKGEKSTVEVIIRDDLIVIETCADSTQTFIAIMNGLQPPMPPKSELKYRTEVVPVQDMIATLSGDDFAVYEEEADDVDYSTSLDEEGDPLEDDVPENLEFVEGFYNPTGSDSSLLVDGSSGARSTGKRKATLPSFHERAHVPAGQEALDFKDDHFADRGNHENTRRWSSKKNAYEPVSNLEKMVYPFKLSMQDVHLIWNLFDGYDWQRTRDAISEAVAEVENKAADMRARRRRSRSLEEEDEPDPVIEDFLFNSIYIGVGTNQSPRDLARNINRNIDDLVSEADSYSTTTGTSMSPSPNRRGNSRGPRRSRLRLQRSRHHKMTFELKGLNVDFKTLPPDSGETQSSLDLKVRDLDIFDHVPTSTWKKFVTYMHDAGERESGTNMIRIEILNVKPVPELAASEMIFKATVLPLRLHVDQDALDFLTRFFEFKDDRDNGAPSASEAPFIQRAEINSIPVKLDFKPKRVDYGGLRSGRTTEFMNFMILDAADMVMRHVIIYGVSGFDRLGKTLNDVWMPDIRRNQLPGVLAGLAPVRPLVNVGSGVRDLVVIPMREYRKDGRVIRSIQKGAFAFAKTTTTELAKLGAKLAVGTHTALQNAEEILSPQSAAGSASSPSAATFSDAPPEERAVISPYAELPIGVVQGLRGAYRQLERDLLLARDAIVAMPGEVMESGSAQGAAKAVIRGAPTVILRPALGVTKAVGQTLMGAATSLDRDERRRIEEKYKRH